MNVININLVRIIEETVNSSRRPAIVFDMCKKRGGRRSRRISKLLNMDIKQNVRNKTGKTWSKLKFLKMANMPMRTMEGNVK